MNKQLFDFNAKMLCLLLNKQTSSKIAYSEITGWHDSHPYYRLNFYDGIQISQVLGIYIFFNKEWLGQFDHIIEIGSYNGGLSSYIYDSKKTDATFVSYDIDHKINQAKYERGRTEIDFKIGDCFEEAVYNEIKEGIERKGRVLMICDGGNKTKEFIEFSKYLKPDDVIVLHDYKDEREEKLFFYAKDYWQWPYMFECSYESIKEAVELNGLAPFDYEKSLFYLWGCFIKK